MARRAQRASNAKRARKVTPIEPQLWNPPAIEECDEDNILIEPDLTNRVLVRLVRWNGQLVSYAVVHSTLVGPEDWQEISSIDCSHNYVHRHHGRGAGKTPELIRPISSQQDVQDSFHDSYDEIYDGYLEFKERWGND